MLTSSLSVVLPQSPPSPTKKQPPILPLSDGGLEKCDERVRARSGSPQAATTMRVAKADQKDIRWVEVSLNSCPRYPAPRTGRHPAGRQTLGTLDADLGYRRVFVDWQPCSSSPPTCSPNLSSPTSILLPMPASSPRHSFNFPSSASPSPDAPRSPSSFSSPASPIRSLSSSRSSRETHRQHCSGSHDPPLNAWDVWSCPLPLPPRSAGLCVKMVPTGWRNDPTSTGSATCLRPRAGLGRWLFGLCSERCGAHGH